MWKNVLVLFISILFVSGCAAIISGSEERISVNSIDPDATIFINGAVRGEAYRYRCPKKIGTLLQRRKKAVKMCRSIQEVLLTGLHCLIFSGDMVCWWHFL